MISKILSCYVDGCYFVLIREKNLCTFGIDISLNILNTYLIEPWAENSQPQYHLALHALIH